MNDNSINSIEDLFELKGADREAKAYAFLYAAFKRTEISANPVRDALDCLIPFIVPYINEISGKQVTPDGIQNYLRQNFGFDIPLYAIDQIIQTLQSQNFVEYKRNLKAHFALNSSSKFNVIKSEIETEFDDTVSQLEEYAKNVGFTLSPPPSGTWGDALIRFLRVRTEKTSAKVTKVKNVLLDPFNIEMAVVGGFIQKLNEEKSKRKFEKIVKIFMGVLIEDFISSVTSIGIIKTEKPVTVFYDTAVLLRQLGCSGEALRLATEELTRYLQDLGFQIKYFSGNESEVNNIISTIVYLKDTGKELEGETAIAIANGEVATSDLRLLQNAFPERLASFNIFPAGELEQNALENARYQIDERDFSHYINRIASSSGRSYGQQNRENDAGYLAAVMRLKKGVRARDLAECGYVFVTSNTFLARNARRYLIEQRLIGPTTFPPVLALGQIATIAWLLKDHSIPPEKAGRELLTNCFAAVRPDAEWFKHFREGMEKISGPFDDASGQNKNYLTIQAARRIAQEESFGNSSIVRQLNMAEILSRAEQEYARNDEIQRANHEKEKLLAVEDATKKAIILEKNKIEEEIKSRIAEKSRKIVRITTYFAFIFSTISLIYIPYMQLLGGDLGIIYKISLAFAGLISIASVADLFKLPITRSVSIRLQRWVERLITP
ncbi:hypothetical protein [Stappia indica]|uniref:hypothetical protein n=1 Tax=Stappia indica TaxID=538381 RepID=UPI000A9F08EA|nr:hypothetical protein [Stappia indica]